ncbi:MAG: ATPase [Hyphomicrobiales bacterium]|nr:SRPBCC domain-containing protein [Hyphomicrobiales bacterium]PCH50121.1 MAG: ATPase [Hyphomicrobiales bacterium]
MTTSIVKTAFFAADKETVWAFLTDKDKLGEWFYQGDENLSDGAKFTLYGKDDDGNKKKMVWGEVKKWNPFSELVHSFYIAPLEGSNSELRWLLEDVGNGTKLTLEHSGMSVEGEAFNLIMHLDTGWDKHLAALREAAGK